jgi:hypothetical protein
MPPALPGDGYGARLFDVAAQEWCIDRLGQRRNDAQRLLVQAAEHQTGALLEGDASTAPSDAAVVGDTKHEAAAPGQGRQWGLH